MTSEFISCEHSLQALASAPAADLVGDTPLARHLSTCPDCARVGSVVLERERSLSLALDSLTPRADPVVITDAAMLARERHGTARFVRWLLVGALGVTVWFALDSVLGPLDRQRVAYETLTIPLTCLSGDQARDLVQPYLQENGDKLVASGGLQALVLQAPPNELARASAVIAEFEKRYTRTETGACQLNGQRAPSPGTPTTAPTH